MLKERAAVAAIGRPIRASDGPENADHTEILPAWATGGRCATALPLLLPARDAVDTADGRYWHYARFLTASTLTAGTCALIYSLPPDGETISSCRAHCDGILLNWPDRTTITTTHPVWRSDNPAFHHLRSWFEPALKVTCRRCSHDGHSRELRKRET